MGDRVSEVLSAIEPYAFKIVVTLLLVVAAFFGYRYVSSNAGTASVGGARVVVFDVVKLANAQRRVAAQFLGKDPAAVGEDGTLLLEMQARTKEAIRNVAGPGVIVLVKQAVVHTDLPDITADVLKELKLPLDVPTQDGANSGIDFAPTVLGLTPPPKSFAQKRAVANPLMGSGDVLP